MSARRCRELYRDPSSLGRGRRRKGPLCRCQSHQLCSSLNSSQWNIGDPVRASVASLELLEILGNLDNALTKWLRPASQGHGQMPINNPGLRCVPRLNDFDRRSRHESREVSSGRFDFPVCDSPRNVHHQLWVSTRHRCLPRPAFEFRHLLRNVCNRKARKSRVFRTTRPVGPMAAATSEHGRLSSPSYDFRHRRVIVWVPIRRKVQITDLGERERRPAVWHVQGTAVICRHRQIWRVNGIGPCGRSVSECGFRRPASMKGQDSEAGSSAHSDIFVAIRQI